MYLAIAGFCLLHARRAKFLGYTCKFHVKLTRVTSGVMSKHFEVRRKALKTAFSELAGLLHVHAEQIEAFHVAYARKAGAVELAAKRFAAMGGEDHDPSIPDRDALVYPEQLREQSAIWLKLAGEI